MAQTFTLEQAAERLGLSPEEFKRRLRDEWKSVRSFRDGPTLRFRTADIDELARSLGQASDPGLPLGAPGVPLTDSSEEIPITLPSQKAAKSPTRKPVDEPLLLDDDASEDALAVPLDTGGSRIGKKAKPTGDSDVRLDLTPSAQDVSASDITEELSFELPAAGESGVLKGGSSVKLSNPLSAKLAGPPSSAKLTGPASGKFSGPTSGKIPGPASVSATDDGSSEFELSLDSDSDSLELTLNTDSSAEVDLGSFAADPKGSRSGIKLDTPVDRGVPLGKKPAQDDDSDDFELSLDAASPVSVEVGGRRKPEDASSEFELSLDDNSGVTDGLMDDFNAEAEDKGDIFETDFELPVVSDEESGSEVVAIESSDTDLENSDFDIAIEDSDAPMDDESASQVVLVDDDMMPIEDDADAMVLSDDDAQPVSPSRKRRLLADDDDVMIGEEETEEGASASKALRGVRKPDADEDDLPLRMGPAPAAKWGVLPALFLLPSLVVVMLGGLMVFEMLRGQWGYTQPSKPSDALVRGVAKAFDMKVSD